MIEQIKKLIRPIYHSARRLLNKPQDLTPSLAVSEHNYPLIRLGSAYGGWTFVDASNLKKSAIVSCGLGEDASFDVEFATKYDATVIIVDPTPRAILHYEGISSRIGKNAEQSYAQDGSQPIDAYDLSHLSQTQLLLCKKALWKENTQLRFFKPPNPAHVSHSILNYQNAYSTNTDYIDVEAVTIEKLLKDYSLKHIELMKLDIEGAEIEVLLDMLSKNIYPKQVLVEYDELSAPSKKSKERIESAHNALIRAGYRLINRDHTNFTYILDSN